MLHTTCESVPRQICNLEISSKKFSTRKTELGTVVLTSRALTSLYLLNVIKCHLL